GHSATPSSIIVAIDATGNETVKRGKTARSLARKLGRLGSEFRHTHYKVPHYQPLLACGISQSTEQIRADHDPGPTNSRSCQLVLAGIVLGAPRHERESDTVAITVGA